LSARSFVQSAKASGYRVTAIDGFSDRETMALADTSIKIRFDQQGFDAEQLLATISALDTSQYLGFVYGSGFEAQPMLLNQIALMMPIIGNSAETVSAVKTANSFFKKLQKLNILFPKIIEQTLIEPHEILLRKFGAGCGGTHISLVEDVEQVQAHNHYYQQYIKGRNVSLLFLAYRNKVEVIGFNEQWVNASSNFPFRYGGAMNGALLPPFAQEKLIAAAQKLTLTFGLLGLNSLDAILTSTDVYVLEVNPRLSATVGLYAEANLLQRHLQASLGYSSSVAIRSNVITAHALVYAFSDMKIFDVFEWPSWVVDTPNIVSPFILFEANNPVCTVVAEAEDAESAKQLVSTRVKIMQQLLEASKGNL